MKKGILFALAALCVSAVQAVTINWANNKGFGDFTATGAVELTVTFVATTDTPLTTNAQKFKLGNLSPLYLAGNGGEIEINAGNRVWSQGDFSDGRLAGKTTDGAYATNTMTFYFNVNDNGDWAATQYKIIFANGDTEGPKNFSNGATLTLSTNAVLAWTTAEDGTMHFTGATLSGDGLTAVVPEPTALALLALGVAGLALRRKVA